MFLEFTTPIVISMSLPMVTKERNVTVYSLEKDTHAANFPDQLRSGTTAFHL